jgi:hypothetical protein
VMVDSKMTAPVRGTGAAEQAARSTSLFKLDR